MRDSEPSKLTWIIAGLALVVTVGYMKHKEDYPSSLNKRGSVPVAIAPAYMIDTHSTYGPKHIESSPLTNNSSYINSKTLEALKHAEDMNEFNRTNRHSRNNFLKYRTNYPSNVLKHNIEESEDY